jgi:glyoxylase I family protein
MPVADSSAPTFPTLSTGDLRRVHHYALNVQNLPASRHFYGQILGLHELTGDEIPSTLKGLVAAGKVTNFVTPDGTVLDLFAEPDLSPPDPNPHKQFTRANHLAFDIAPELFDRAVEVLRANQVPIDHGPVTRPTGRGIYFYDPDGFLLEIRCDPVVLLHITSGDRWQDAQRVGEYRPESLDTEGFIHCCLAAQLPGVVQRFYPEPTDLVVLSIDPTQVQATIQYEPVAEEGIFPHLYGPLNLKAVTQVHPLASHLPHP